MVFVYSTYAISKVNAKWHIMIKPTTRITNLEVNAPVQMRVKHSAHIQQSQVRFCSMD